MSAKEITLLIFSGGRGGSPVEQLVGGAREAAALDLIDRAHEIEAIGRIVVATPSRSFAEELRARAVEVERVDEDNFHFGRELWRLIEKYKIRRLLYFGGGSGALLSQEGLASLAEFLLEEEIFLVNNFYSTDFAALAPAPVLLESPPPPRDNQLGWLLWKAGHKPAELPRTAATQFDIDTPTDLLILKLHPDTGTHTRRYLEAAPLGPAPLEATLDYFTDREAMVLVAGRVPSYAWRYLEEETACQVRVFSEERGMEASGRAEQGTVRSLVGFFWEEVGPARFFQALGELADLALLDSRVLFAHLGRRPSASDRFWSDLLRPEEIGDPLVKEFTVAAKEAPIPIILGGHSLVSGGLYALVELAWQGRELPRRVELLSDLDGIKEGVRPDV
jgi:hypothetical protein